MAFINEIEKPGSHIESYVNSMEQVYMQQIEKVTYMKTRLLNFKHLLKEEEELSGKILRMNEVYGSAYGDSFTVGTNCNNSQSNLSKNEGEMCDDF
jgi:hypothetical protein